MYSGREPPNFYQESITFLLPHKMILDGSLTICMVISLFKRLVANDRKFVFRITIFRRG